MPTPDVTASWAREHLLLLVLLAVYVSVMAFLAVLGKKKTHGTLDYYVGGRSIGGFAIGLSFFATYASTNSYLGFSGQSYSYGIAWLLMIPFAVGFNLLAWTMVAPRLREATERLDSVTIPDFLGFRFSSPAARVVAALVLLFASLLYMTAVYKGIGNLVQAYLDVPYWVAILLVLLVVVLYTSVGGFHSVVRTDVVQGLLMVLAAVVLYLGIAGAAGGLEGLRSLAEGEQTSRLFRWDAALPLPVLLGVVFASTVKFVVEPRQLSRFYALKDRGEIRTGVWVSTAAFLIVFSLLVPLGLYGRILLPDLGDTDRVVPELLARGDIFGPTASAFLFLAIFSAALSSLDSVLLVMASTLQRDLVRLVRPAGPGTSDLGDLRATRIFVVLFALVTAGLAVDPPAGIVALTSFSGSLYAACFLPSVVLGLWWSRGNGRSALASIGTGLVVLLGWNRLPGSGGGIHPVFPAVLLSLAVYSVVAVATDPAREKAAAHPSPGR